MKLNYIYALALLLVGATIACNKEYPVTAFNTPLSTDKANIKVVSATLSAARNYVYSNTIPLSGAALAYGGTFPANSSGYSVIYTSYNNITVKDTAAITTQVPITFLASIEGGKYYSLFTYDTITATKYKLVEDKLNFSLPDTAARIRFANLIFSTTAIPNVDIFSKRQNTNVFTNIPSTTITDFLPFQSKLTDTLFVRETGTTNLLFQFNTFTPDVNRYYTLVYRGRAQNTTGAAARTLASVTNY